MFSAVLFLFSTDIVVNLKKQKINKYVTVLLFILYSKWVHVENPKYKIICLKSQTSSEFAKKTVVKNPILCLFHHVLTTIQLIFKNREIKNIKCSASVGIRPGFWGYETPAL